MQPLSINGVDIQIMVPICRLNPNHRQQMKKYVPNFRWIDHQRWKKYVPNSDGSIISDGINNIAQSARGSINHGDCFIQTVWHMNNSKSDQLPGDEEYMTVVDKKCFGAWRTMMVDVAAPVVRVLYSRNVSSYPSLVKEVGCALAAWLPYQLLTRSSYINVFLLHGEGP
jgi:hypothetical protein